MDFYIELKTESTENYFVYIPIALNNDDKNISTIMDTLSIIKGNGTYNICDTKYGMALNISSKNSIIIQSFEKKYVPYAFISLTNTSINYYEPLNSKGENFSFWAYYNGEENSSLKIRFYICME